MVTIAAPRAWALGTLRQRSWMSHVLTVGTWPWRCCAPDTSSLDVGVSPLLCPVLVPPDGGLLRLRARVIWGSQWELPHRVRLRGPLTPRAHRTVWGSRVSMRGQWYPKLHKSSFLFLRVPRGRGWQCARPRLHIPIPLSLRQWAAGSGPRTRCLLPRPLPSRGARWVLHHTLRPHFETLCLSSRAPGLHCAAPPRVRLCLPWSRLYGPWGPG